MHDKFIDLYNSSPKSHINDDSFIDC